MAFLGSKQGVRSTFFGQKSTHQNHVMGAKHGGVMTQSRAVSVNQARGRGDLGNGTSAPGNTTNAVANGSRDAVMRPEGVRSMADPRPNKRAKTLESGKKNKAA